RPPGEAFLGFRTDRDSSLRGDSAEQLVEGDAGDLLAIEDQRQGLTRTVGLEPGVLASTVDDPGRGVDQDGTTGDIDDPVSRNPGAGVLLQRRGQVDAEAGDGDLDQQADVSRLRVALGGGTPEQFAGADDGEVRQRGVGGVQDDRAFGPET